MENRSPNRGSSAARGTDAVGKAEELAVPRPVTRRRTATSGSLQRGVAVAAAAINYQNALVPPSRSSSRTAAAHNEVLAAMAAAKKLQQQAYAADTYPSRNVSAARSRTSGGARSRSISMRWSVAVAEPDLEVDDELTKVQKHLRDLKLRISAQSKKNFLLERDVRYLDSRIALLIQNRMLLDEYITNALPDESESDSVAIAVPDEKKKQAYGNLFFLLQTEPRLVAHLTRLLNLSEIDSLLQTVMFTIYGNQYDNREEHLLLTMFQSVLSAQFEAATDFGSLLRANTPASRMMTTYTRRGPGQQYLKFVLSENINHLIADPDINLEINPLKVYEQMRNQQEMDTGLESPLPRTITQEEAEANVQVQQLIQPRLECLTEIANRFLDTIIGELDQVPYGIRWICKQIKQLSRQKYPDATEMSICSLIGGFFFLRYINPAIVTPQSYMIVDQQPMQNPRRTLTLIAKMLQNLANKPTHNKETYMASLGHFTESNKGRVLQFLSELCDVEDFYESLEMDQYMTLSMKGFAINISLNEMYNTHSQLLQHVDTICPVGPSLLPSHATTPEESYATSCHQLRVILGDLGMAAAQLPRKDNKTISLTLFSRWETAPILFPHMVEAISSKETSNIRARQASDMSSTTSSPHQSAERLACDNLFLETKTALLKILRKQAVVDAAHNRNFKTVLNVTDVLRRAISQTLDPVMAASGHRVRKNLQVLADRYHHELVDASDGYTMLTTDLMADLSYLSNLLSKLRLEVEPLETVYRTICDHNNYLRSQLESYKAYLHNVRLQAGGGDRWTGSPKDKTSKSKSIDSSVDEEKKKGSGSMFKTKHTSLSKRADPIDAIMLKFSHMQLEKDGVIVESGVPDGRRSNIFFNIQSPSPGSFTIGLHYKGRDKAIMEVDMKLDDLLEKQHDNVQYLDLEYVKLNVNKTLHLLNKSFVKR